MDPAQPFLTDGTVVLDGARIAWVGATADHLAQDIAQDDDVIVDASRRVVIPGLVNAHYHVDLGKGAGESSNETKPMWDLLFDDWYPFLGQLTEEEAYWATMASYAESVRNGVTTVNDMYVLTPVRARAANDLGLRAVLSSEIATPETGIDTVADNVEAFHAVNGASNGPGLARVWLGVEWLPCASPELLTEVRAAATDLGTGIHIHLNESMSEVEDALARFGKRPTELAHSLGFLGPDVVAAHCVHLSDAEIAMMAETGTHISHNPGSNAYLGNGIARMNDFRAAGINVGMGTDAGFCSDLFEIMRWATYLHRATSRDVTVRKSAEALRMATLGGSTALGQDTGVLAAGKLADLTLIDVDSVKFAMLDRTDAGLVEEFVVNHANGSDVATTIVNGEIVMRDRVLTKVDEAAITEGVARSIREANRRFFGGH
jgi:5-methylthioadenosine/S-adenosylhomocysteine deaminase